MVTFSTIPSRTNPFQLKSPVKAERKALARERPHRLVNEFLYHVKKPPKSEPKTQRTGKTLDRVSDNPMVNVSEEESDSECLKKKKELKDKLRRIQVKNNTIRSTVNDILQFL